MDNIEIQSMEAFEAGEGSEQTEAQRLNDVTFEPRAYVEQSGDYQQSEAIQAGFTAVLDNIANLARGTVTLMDRQGGGSMTGFGEKGSGKDQEPYALSREDIKYSGDWMAGYSETGDKAGALYQFDRSEIHYEGDHIDGYREEGSGISSPGGEGVIAGPTHPPGDRNIADGEISTINIMKGTEGVPEIPLPGVAGEIGSPSEGSTADEKSDLRQEMTELRDLQQNWPEGLDSVTIQSNWIKGQDGSYQYVDPPRDVILMKEDLTNRIDELENILNTLSDMSQLDQLDLQDRMQKSQQLFQTISNIINNEYDTLKAIIQNIKA